MFDDHRPSFLDSKFFLSGFVEDLAGSSGVICCFWQKSTLSSLEDAVKLPAFDGRN